MALSANPAYRLITPPTQPDAATRASLSVPLHLARLVAMIPLFVLLLYFVWGGTIESRVYYLLAFFISFINPIWGYYGLALVGPMLLLDPGKHHLLAGIEVFILGIAAAELRLLGRPISGRNPSGSPDARFSLGPGMRAVDWGLWPYLVVGLLLLLCASSLTGLQFTLFQEQPYPLTDNAALNLLNQVVNQVFYGAATVPEWTLKSLWNWATGILIAYSAARRADPLIMARWLKLAGLGLLVVCAFSLLDWIDWLPLTHIRRPNPDPLHAGRLQGTAGHAGWYAQWIVVVWPGLLLWWSTGRTRRNAVIGVSLAIVALCLFLTGARAAWLGLLLSTGIFAAYLSIRQPSVRRNILIAAIALVFLAALAALLGGHAVQSRLATFLRFEDRANYYITGLLFLREHPLGLGLGTHYQFYDWMISPFFRWSQVDHVTAHSFWLHALIENGPFVPLMVLAMLALLAREYIRALPRFDAHMRGIVIAATIGPLAVIVISLAQYILYIRIVEIALWLSAGLLVGLIHKQNHRVDGGVDHPWGRHAIVLCGALAILMALSHAGRQYTGRLPRYISSTDAGGLALWTGAQWRTAVSADIDRISFGLYRIQLPVSGAVTWPDGTTEKYRLVPGESRSFVYTRPPAPARWTDTPAFLTITATPLFTPSGFDEQSTDQRQLGVYVSDLVMDSSTRRENDQPLRRY